jgi:4-diphosphocytidyl-2-C-methyl-D-erythritol kinase
MTTQGFIRFPAPAKINLFLHINGRRQDGYHELQTIFQFLDISDQLDFKVSENSEVTLLTPIKGVANEDNLIVRAAHLLQQQSGISQGCQIKIEKHLPMGGGLGGGSSNAATTLLALNYLWQAHLSLDELAALGLQLGADVPVFIRGYAAFAEGVGEKLQAVNPTEHYYLITCPNVSISTAEIFQSEHLKRNTPKMSLTNLQLETCVNDCQDLVIKNYPEVAKLLAWLVEYAPSKMTGTGACLFSAFDTEQQARELQSQLPANVLSFVTKGNNQSILHSVLSQLVN